MDIEFTVAHVLPNRSVSLAHTEITVKDTCVCKNLDRKKVRLCKNYRGKKYVVRREYHGLERVETIINITVINKFITVFKTIYVINNI